MAGFDVSYAFGKLTIGSIVVPNNAMKFQEDGPLDLLFDQFSGEDREVIDGVVLMPRGDHGIRAQIPLIVGAGASTTGTAATDKTQQLVTNLGVLHTIAAASATSTPTTSFTYEPYIGATSRSGSAVMLPPQRGAVIPGVGVRVVWDWILTGPPT
jgi:hypothetical protein